MKFNIKNIKNIKNKKNIYIICVILIAIIAIISSSIINMNSNMKKTIGIKNMIGKTASRKIVKIKDSNGDIFFLPKGFKISENVAEQTVQNGLVIIDDNNDKQTHGSEFVWIPVDNSNKKEFETKFTNVLGISYRTLDVNLLKESTDVKEYVDIKNSVYKYGGFYVARYEAGISEKMYEELKENNYMEYDNIIKDTTNEYANEQYKPVSKANAVVWNYISWGGNFEDNAYDGFGGDDTKNGAVKVARNMYNSFTSAVTSTLCYASQWEAIMNFIDKCYSDGTCDENSVIVNSVGIGNNYGKLQKTGSDANYFQKNIADLSGNVWEWTMENFNDMHRVTRGGAYTQLGDTYTISGSKEFYPNDYFKDIGFRVALYIKIK